MPLEPIIEEITRKGQLRVSEIRSEAEREASKIIEEAKEKSEELLKKAREEAEREAERLRKQEIAAVNLELKREELNKKKEVLDEVYSKLIERLRNMDDEEKKKILSKIIEKHGRDGYRVYSNKEDESIVRELTSMEYAGNIHCVGGVIIESPDGSFRINMTFDELVKGIYESKMKEVSDMLFR